jgi:hypothetical protein
MMNLHAVVRSAVTSLHPDETVTLYQSKGQQNVRGRIIPVYAEPQVVQAQIQLTSGMELQHSEAVSRTRISGKAYLFASQATPPAGIIRLSLRNGDFLQRGDGSWWLITSVQEDFSSVGWVCVGITEQIEAPEIGGE